MPHETVSPHELLGTHFTLVRFYACVRFHVFRKVVFHLELLSADRAVEGAQVEVHIDVAVTHALV